MKLVDIEVGKKYRIYNTIKPKFSNHRGKTWDKVTSHVNGVKTEFYIDTTWGKYFYFEYNNKWYKLLVSSFPDLELPQNFVIQREVD